MRGKKGKARVAARSPAGKGTAKKKDVASVVRLPKKLDLLVERPSWPGSGLARTPN